MPKCFFCIYFSFNHPEYNGRKLHKGLIMGEPNLNEIEDYNNNESKNKRKVVLIVIGLCLLIGTIIAVSRGYFTSVDDELATKQETGIPKY